jgi:hypothetical protein
MIPRLMLTAKTQRGREAATEVLLVLAVQSNYH